MSKIKKAQDLAQAYHLAAEHDSMVLAEEFIEGVELTAAIVGEETLPLVKIEVDTQRSNQDDDEAKEQNQRITAEHGGVDSGTGTIAIF